MHGLATSDIEISLISNKGFWLLLKDEELFVLHRGDDRSASTTLLKNIEGKLIERGIKDPSSDAFRRMTLTNLLNELQMCGYLVINKQKNAKFIDSIALGQPVKKN